MAQAGRGQVQAALTVRECACDAGAAANFHHDALQWVVGPDLQPVAVGKWVPYAYVYPWVETGAGILMTGMLLTPLAAPAALLIATIGAISVFKAVYIDKRELKCACIGGNSNVPLGFVSLTENLMMIGMSIVMLMLMVF